MDGCATFAPRQQPGEDEWIVVTGGGSGIGAMLVRHFAERGFRVLTCGRRSAALEATRASCSAVAGRVATVACDVATEAGRAMLATALPADAALRLLVQNAAVGDPSSLERLDLDHWEYALRVNVTAPLFLVQALLGPLRRGRGRILHLGTGVAFRPQQGTATYGITKAAFFRLYQQLNADLSTTGIVAGSLSPGIVDTEGVQDHVAKARHQQLPHVAFFDQAFRDGRTTDPKQLMRLFDLALAADDERFAGHEWSLRDLTSETAGQGSTPPAPVLSRGGGLVAAAALGLAAGVGLGWLAGRQGMRGRL